MKQSWEKVKLPEVVFFQEGPGLRKFQYTEEGIPFLNIRTLVNDRIDKTLCGHISEKEVKEKYQHFLLNEGDIICSTSGTIGKLAIVQKEDLPVMLNTSVIRFRELDTSVVFKKFIYYYLKSDLFLFQAKDAAKGQAQVNFGPSHLKNFDFVLPPLPEQQHIVSILDEAFAAIAKAKSNAEQNLKNAKELFESYLQGVFEKKGDGWETDKFVNLCNLITCGVAATPKYVDESVGVPFLSAQNVRDGEVVLDKFKYISKEFHKELTKKNKPQKGDILYSRVGAKYGEAGVVEHDFEFSVYVSVTLIKPKSDKLDNYFLKHLLNSPTIKEVARKSISSSGVPNLNVKDVREFLLSYPSITIQKKIVKEIETMRAETQKLEAMYQKKMDDIEELKKSILQKAFAGEL